MLFDPRKVPFSTHQSFLCLSFLEGALWLRNLRGGDEHTDQGRLLRLDVVADGALVAADWTLTPGALTAHVGTAWLALSFDGSERIVLEAQGLGLRLSAGSSKYDYAQDAGDHLHVSLAAQDLRCDIKVQSGRQSLDAPWNGLSADRIVIDLGGDRLAASLDLYRVTPSPRPLTPQPMAASRAEADFAAFRAALAPCLPDHDPGHRLAAYILWANYVPAEGTLSRPAVYMSKNWMTNIWSWDHCFVALALPPALAWDQMAVIFAAQHPSGRLPDYLNDRHALWAFTKPPVHGWTFAQLDPPQRRLVLRWLRLQVDNWLGGPSWQGLPAYRHGNDAGWDNATPFAEGAPVVTPDLATFLILQLDEIARLHDLLGEPAEGAAVRAEGDRLCELLCRHLWTGTGFAARLLDGRQVAADQSLLLLLPLLLGSRITSGMQAKLLANLKNGGFLTPQGLATESTRSPWYRANGYWRGPIWAPTTLLFIDALNRMDETGLADDIARRYLNLCQQNGMAENHDALTGEGLHDPAFAWTSAVYLILAARLQTRDRMISR